MGPLRIDYLLACLVRVNCETWEQHLSVLTFSCFVIRKIDAGIVSRPLFPHVSLMGQERFFSIVIVYLGSDRVEFRLWKYTYIAKYTGAWSIIFCPIYFNFWDKGFLKNHHCQFPGKTLHLNVKLYEKSPKGLFPQKLTWLDKAIASIAYRGTINLFQGSTWQSFNSVKSFLKKCVDGLQKDSFLLNLKAFWKSKIILHNTFE